MMRHCPLRPCRERLSIATLGPAGGAAGSSSGSPFGPAPWPPQGRDKSGLARRSTGLTFPPPPTPSSGEWERQSYCGMELRDSHAAAPGLPCVPAAGAALPLHVHLPCASVPPREEEQPLWTDQVWASPLGVRRRVFCNRSLNMRSIAAVGFDMVSWAGQGGWDGAHSAVLRSLLPLAGAHQRLRSACCAMQDYTLAQYKPNTFEALAHEQTIDKLVRFFGYPEVGGAQAVCAVCTLCRYLPGPHLLPRVVHVVAPLHPAPRPPPPADAQPTLAASTSPCAQALRALTFDHEYMVGMALRAWGAGQGQPASRNGGRLMPLCRRHRRRTPTLARRPVPPPPPLQVRGLVIDKKRGNMLKVDRHK